jgi:hypothetical protein
LDLALPLILFLCVLVGSYYYKYNLFNTLIIIKDNTTDKYFLNIG